MFSRFANKGLRSSVVRDWLLPSLIARVLIPMGFMPGNLWAGEYMVPCPTAMPDTVFAVSGEGRHAHHDHHASEDSGDLVGAERHCPIGLVLNALFVAAPDAPFFSYPRVSSVFSFDHSSLSIRASLQRYRSRAPPIVS